MASAQAFIFLSVDKPLSLLGWPSRLVEIQLPTDPLHHPELIITVENLKLLGQAGFTPMCLEEPVR